MNQSFKELVKERIPPEAAIVGAFVFMMVAGYGVWAMENSGTLSVTAPLYETKVYIDNAYVGSSQTVGQKLKFDETTGKHTVIVSKDGFWPWSQMTDVKKGSEVTLAPFLIQKTLKAEPIPALAFSDGELSTNKEYADGLALFENQTLSEAVAVAVSKTELKEVRYADFFPGRTDVLLISIGTKIFAVDAMKKNPRNYQPIYEGKEPTFVKNTDNTITIKDGSDLFILRGLVPTQ